MYKKCERLCVVGSAPRCVHACIRACVHVCMLAYMRAHTSAYTFAARCRLPNNVQEKRTVSHDTPQHGLEVLLLLVKSQRSISCWVTPNISPYQRVASSKFFEHLQKNQKGTFFAVL